MSGGPARPRGVAHFFTVARYALLVAVIAFAVVFFARQWGQITAVISEISAGFAVASFLVMILGMVANVFSWIVILNGLGHVVSPPRAAQIMLVGQLGKYVPGSVWAYLMQMELGRQYGVARARVLVTVLYATGVGAVASLILGISVVSTVSVEQPALAWLYLTLPVALVCLHPRVMTALSNVMLRLFRRPPLEHRVGFATIFSAVAWSLLSYLLYGLHLQLLVGDSAPASLLSVIMLGGALSLGFTASLIAFVLPSGAGVREAVVIAVLTTLSISFVDSSAFALVSRAMFTAGDLLLAGVAVIVVLLLRRSLWTRDAATSEYEELGDWHATEHPHGPPAP